MRTQTESGGFLEINDKDLFKGLRIRNRKTQLGNMQSVPKKKKAELF